MAENERIIDAPIITEMKEAYVDYAMSVIVSRALPDVRDGLKPVHRRILFTMNEEHITYDKKFRKSAATVGNVLARYHPHGDSSVYDAMVRLAQPFNTRYPLIMPQGNFGSIDGDSAAHMRYTEAKLSKLSSEVLRDLGKNTVDWRPNFDNTCQEPEVLPTVVPNLLINGSEGIAVGMATKIPPHNLGEIIDGTLALLADPNISVEGLMKYVIGPDFPTGALILGKRGIREAYTTGRGCITMRAVMNVEEIRKDKEAIVVTEIPYQVNKANMLMRIADAVKDGRIEKVTDLRDESNREGIRVVIELAKDARPKVVMSQLYKYSELETNYNAIMLALVDNVPRVLTLKEMLQHFIEHRRVVVRRRTEFDLNKALARNEIVEGLLAALDHIDEIITLIRASSDVDSARSQLMGRFGFTERQAQAILDMRLQKLTGLERGKLQAEHEELLAFISYLQGLLSNQAKMDGVIRAELLDIRAKFGDARRTRIILGENGTEFVDEDLIPNVPVVVTMSGTGYLKRMPVETFRVQKRGGRGIKGTGLKDEDFLADFFVTNTHNYLLFFTNQGRMYRLRVYEVPEFGRDAKGTATVNLLKLGESEKVTAIIPITSPEQDGSIITITKMGLLKRTPLQAYCNVRVGGLIAFKLREGDELVSVLFSPKVVADVPDDDLAEGEVEETEAEVVENDDGEGDVDGDVQVADESDSDGNSDGEDGDDDEEVSESVESGDGDLIIVTRGGQALRFSENKVPLRKRRDSLGVKGIKLRHGDEVVAMDLVANGEQMLVVTSKGFAKRTAITHYPCKGRNTLGVRTLTRTNVRVVGHIVAALMVNCPNEVQSNSGIVVDENDDVIDSTALDEVGSENSEVVSQLAESSSQNDDDLDSLNDEVMVSSAKGVLIRTRVEEIRLCRRREAQGVRIMRLSEDDCITAVARIVPSEAIAAAASQSSEHIKAFNGDLGAMVEISASDPQYQGEAQIMYRDNAQDSSELALLARAEEQRAEEEAEGDTE